MSNERNRIQDPLVRQAQNVLIVDTAVSLQFQIVMISNGRNKLNTSKVRLGYNAYRDQLQKGAKLLVESIAYSQSAMFADSIERRIEELETASHKKNRAYEILSTGLNDDIIRAFNNAVSVYFAKKKDDYLLSLMSLDWNMLQEKHRTVKRFNQLIGEKKNEVRANANRIHFKLKNIIAKLETEKKTNSDIKPVKPKGFLASFKHNKYVLELDQWKIKNSRLERRLASLQKRLAVVDQFTSQEKNSALHKSALKKLMHADRALVMQYNAIVLKEREKINEMKKLDAIAEEEKLKSYS